MIDRGDIRQAIDRCSNIWASLPGAGYGQFEHKADNLITKDKAGGTVREIDVWAESPAIISALFIIIVCLSWAVNHYRDNAITYKAQRDKYLKRTEAGERGGTDMQMRQRDVAALDAKYTKELADAKAENDALRDDVAAGRRRLHIKQSVDQCVKPPPPPAWIQPADWQTPLNELFHPQREADHYAKTTGRNPKYINEQCR